MLSEPAPTRNLCPSQSTNISCRLPPIFKVSINSVRRTARPLLANPNTLTIACNQAGGCGVSSDGSCFASSLSIPSPVLCMSLPLRTPDKEPAPYRRCLKPTLSVATPFADRGPRTHPNRSAARPPLMERLRSQATCSLSSRRGGG